MCASFATFYSLLFFASRTDPSVQDSLLANICSFLIPNEASQCEGLLTLGGCHSALLGMTGCKAPGFNGLPMEFYIGFWEELGQDLVYALNAYYASGWLSRSQRRGIISLVFKRGDRLDVRNWYFITLHNVVYKLASRVSVGRLLKVIHVVASKDQTCGVPDRFIGENVALLRDIVDYASFSNVPTAVLSLDQEKAFDRVDWSFMLATLSKMGLGPSFLHGVRLFYTGVQSCVNVNGYSFCPLSLSFLVVFAKAVLFLPCCMCWFRKSLLLIFEPIHVSQAFLSLGLRRPFRPFSNTLMIYPYR